MKVFVKIFVFLSEKRNNRWVFNKKIKRFGLRFNGSFLVVEYRVFVEGKDRIEVWCSYFR